VSNTTSSSSSSTTTTTAPTSHGSGATSQSQVTPGQAVTITGSEFAANSDLQVSLESDPISMGSIRSDAAGRYSATVVIPAAAKPGSHEIVVRGPAAVGGTRETRAAVTVALPRTGSEPTGPLAAGLAALGIGLLLVATADGRRSRGGEHFLDR
jgi:hypothetical protein